MVLRVSRKTGAILLSAIGLVLAILGFVLGLFGMEAVLKSQIEEVIIAHFWKKNRFMFILRSKISVKIPVTHFFFFVGGTTQT
jgi:hypothetical protein